MDAPAQVPWYFSLVVGLAFACGASHPGPAPATAVAAPPPAPAPAAPPAPDAAATTDQAGAGHAGPRPDLLAYARGHVPEGGDAKLEDGKLVLTHRVKKGDTAATIAATWLELTDIYAKDDLAKAIAHANPTLKSAAVGDAVTIPAAIAEVPKSADDERIGWPADKAIRGIYMHDDGYYGGKNWVPTLERLKARGMNAIVLDFKDYDGRFTYDTKIPLAAEEHASIHHIPDMERAIRFAHRYGIRILAKIACFHDPFTQGKKPELSIKGKWGGPYPIGWLDPGGEAAHSYITDIVKEALTYGIDEVQLDYIRYPVQPGLGNVDWRMNGRERTGVIRDFVRQVHGVTQAKHVPLSLDVFGVIAFGNRKDIEGLGQDLTLLAPECEALSPMVYPSHYDKGFMGWDEPGNHPEIIAIGTKASREQIAAANVPHPAVIRPWLQAFAWKSPEYGPLYLAEETRQAVAGGGTGWLMWNPGQTYGEAWRALPPIESAAPGESRPAQGAPGKPAAKDRPTAARVPSRRPAHA